MSVSSRPTEKSTRVLISEEIVAGALARAARAKDSHEFYDYCDAEQRYLILRQRGPRVGWFVRANGQMKRIGNAKREPGDDSYLTVKKARDIAGARYYAMRSGRRPHTKGWSWADLDREFQASRRVKRKKGKRVKPPAPSTLSDIAGCFDKARRQQIGGNSSLALPTCARFISAITHCSPVEAHRCCSNSGPRSYGNGKVPASTHHDTNCGNRDVVEQS